MQQRVLDVQGVTNRIKEQWKSENRILLDVHQRVRARGVRVLTVEEV